MDTGRYDDDNENNDQSDSWRTKDETMHDSPPGLPQDGGDEAYLRRVALTSMMNKSDADPQSTAALNPVAPSFIPSAAATLPESGEEAYTRRMAMSTSAFVPAVSNAQNLPPPIVERSPSPPDDIIPPASPPAVFDQAAFDEQLRQKKEAAAAIAARLGLMAKAGPPNPPPTTEEQPEKK